MSAKGDLTRQKILDSARGLFYSKGYNNTSIDEILRASKIKKGNFYFHYGSKEDLGYAVIESYLFNEINMMDKILQLPGSPLERLFQLFESSKKNLVENGCRGGCPIGNFALELSDIHEGFRNKINLIFDVWTDRMRVILDEAKKAGEIPETSDTKALANFMVAVWEGGIMLVKTRKDPSVMDDCIHSLRGILTRA